jgi:hypothetical protein
MTTIYDRAAITRHAHQLRRDGMAWSDAMREAWAAARQAAKAPEPAYAKAQPTGFRAALQRYGVNVERIEAAAARISAHAARAMRALAAEATLRLTASTELQLPAPHVIDLRKAADGTWK